jgi:hypothetical protein
MEVPVMRRRRMGARINIVEEELTGDVRWWWSLRN